MLDHDEGKLPKWAQERVRLLRAQIEARDYAISKLKEAHAILFESNSWFTISGPRSGVDGCYHLWMLDKDHPHLVCSLGQNDRLLIGRFDENHGS